MHSKRIRVAFFADILTENLDGAVRTMYQLINRIDRQHFDFLFIYGAGPVSVKKFRSVKVPYIMLPFNRSYSVALPGAVKTRVTKQLQDFDPQIVHIATPSLLGHFALNYASSVHIPVISVYHTHFLSYIDYYFKYAPGLIRPLKKLMGANQSNFYNRCHAVYVPSESTKEELLAIGVADEKLQIWKRGVDTNIFSRSKKDPDLMFNLTGNNYPVILFASRLVWEKNLETLFEIYAGFEKQNVNVNFVVAGDGSARKDCERNMKDALFTGAVNHERLAALYASATVFLFPSVSETYGNVVLEAMGSGLPCVVADGGGSADFIEQGVNGFKCQPYDAADYIEKITLILTNDLMASRFAAKGIAYSKKLSWEKLAHEYFNDLVKLSAINRTGLICKQIKVSA